MRFPHSLRIAVKGVQSLNGWLKAGLALRLACAIAGMIVVEIHSRTPGPFNGAKKVAVRESINTINMAGIVIGTFGMILFVGKQKRNCPENGNVSSSR